MKKKIIKKKRSQTALKILEFIAGGVGNTLEILLAIIISPYGSSYSQIERNKEKLGSLKDLSYNEKRKAENRLRNMLSRLQRDGLVYKNHNKIWKITKKGKDSLRDLKNYYAIKEKRRKKYKKEKSNKLILVIFDIPEKEKHKRHWLRSTLEFLGFAMLQKSVWIGRVKLPIEFIDDIAELELSEYIEIFPVNKLGSIDVKV